MAKLVYFLSTVGVFRFNFQLLTSFLKPFKVNLRGVGLFSFSDMLDQWPNVFFVGWTTGPISFLILLAQILS